MEDDRDLLNNTSREYRGWRIRRRDNGTWQIDRGSNRNRVRAVCQSLEKAQAEIDRREAKIENYGRQGDRLPERVKVETAEALDLTGGRASMTELAKFWLQHHPSGDGKTISEMAAMWTEHQIKNNNRARTVKLNKHRIGSFSDEIGHDTPVAAITRQAALDFVGTRNGCQQTKAGWRSTLHAFFQFCLGDDEATPPVPAVIDSNPLAKKRQKKTGKMFRDQRQPVIWDSATVQKFLWKVEELYPDDAAAFAILFFAGLRPGEMGGQYAMEPESVTRAKKELEPFTAALKIAQDEKRKAVGTHAWRWAERVRIEALEARKPYLDALWAARKEARSRARMAAEKGMDRLRWEDVDLQARTIRVRPETSKRRSSRYVDISDNLAAWLMKYRKAYGTVAPPPATLKKRRQRVQKELKISTWPQDVTRHTYASNHLAEHEDISKTQFQMGHTTADADVLLKHYRALVSKVDAGKFWAICPKVCVDSAEEKTGIA